MPQISLPFSEANKADRHDEDFFQCSLYRMLPKSAQVASQRCPHLLEYLHMVPIDEVGIPQYYTRLSRKLQEINHPHVIYPVTDNVFAHIYPDYHDGRDIYISVEPVLFQNLEPLMLELEKRLLDMADSLSAMNTDEEKKKAFFSCIERSFTTRPEPRGLLRLLGRRDRRIRVTPRQLEGLRYLVVRDKIGLGILEPLVHDPYVEDISCSGVGTIFIEHKVFRSLKTTISFSSYEELDEFVLRLSERIKKPVTFRNPIVDATLPDGSRINIVYGRDVSKRGSNFSIRKFSEVPMSVMELIDLGTMDYRMAAYLSIVIAEGMNVFVAGETASGKTTTLNALTTFIHPNAKIVSIEDTPELQVPHKNWIREVVQTTKAESETGVTMFDLLKAALRQRPNQILVGEIRGPEGNIAFQAMQTGHSVMATFHAASVEKLIQRLTGSPINVPKTYVDNLNVVIIQSAVKLPSGRIGRRVLSINEIVGFDPQTQSFSFVEVFRWNPVNDTFEFTGDMNSYLLEQKIAVRLGIPSHKKRRIYLELQRRAEILERLHKEQGVTGFYELLQVLAKAQREGLF
ncbi:MAG: secretion system protein E [Chloroflexi bacterium]|nr:MAG: secretion system protein E [Chloroflexota bacterium]